MPYKYFGLLSCIILVIGLAFIIWRWPQSRHQTFSQHIAKQTSSIIYYIVLFLIALPPLILFFVHWFTPTFSASIWLNVLVIAGSIFQFACTVAPETGKTVGLHRFLAGLSGACLLPALFVILFSTTIHTAAKTIVIAAIIVMIRVILQIAKYKGEPKNFLLLQVAYYAAFFVPVLVISY